MSDHKTTHDPDTIRLRIYPEQTRLLRQLLNAEANRLLRASQSKRTVLYNARALDQLTPDQITAAQVEIDTDRQNMTAAANLLIEILNQSKDQNHRL